MLSAGAQVRGALARLLAGKARRLVFSFRVGDQGLLGFFTV